MKREHFSIETEPALVGQHFEPDPSLHKAASVGSTPGELEALRDSVAGEPALPEHADAGRWSRWLAERRSRCTLRGNLGVTMVVALWGGPFAVVGAFLTPQQGFAQLVYPLVFAPIIEEFLKQSGMIYLVEKKPFRVFAWWQFVFAAVVSALAFSAIENLVYLQVHSWRADAGDLARLARFRWTVCTSMHVVCAIIASGGMIRVWRRQLSQGRPAELSDAFGFFAAAMIVHGVYNTWAILLGPEF